MKLRRIFLWIHMLGGLSFALYAILLGVSGSLLVFREELTALQYPQFHPGGSPPIPRISPDRALETVQAAYPDGHAYSVTWPNSNSPYYMSYLTRENQAVEVFVDSTDGRVVGARGTSDGFVGTLTQMHFNLLLGGKAGKQVQRFGVIALLAMCVSGLWLWWPLGGARWASRFKVDWSGGWRRLSLQLHLLTGGTGVLFVAMWAVTGGYYLWLNPYISLVDRFFPRSTTPSIEKRAPETLVLSMQELARRAQVEFPGRPLYRMATLAGPEQPVSVTLLEATPAKFHLVSTLALDPVTGAVLQKTTAAERPAGNAILSWISVLHFGRFGGMAVRILWVLMGLTLPLLAVTGCLMWWRRVIEPQLNARDKWASARVTVKL